MFIFSFITALAFWLVYLCCLGRPYLAAMVVILAMIASSITWGQRPQMFTLLFLAIFVNILERFKDKKIKLKQLYVLPLLTILWANMHSGYLLGVVLLGTYTVGTALDLLIGKQDHRNLDKNRIWWLAGITVICFISALLNPNGYHLWIYPVMTLSSNFMQSVLQEWLPPNFHEPRFWAFGVMFIIGIISWLLNKRRPSVTDALLFLGTATAGLLSARHIPIFAVVAAPIMTRSLLQNFKGTNRYPWFSGQLPEQRPTRFISLINMVILVSFILIAASRVHRHFAGNVDAIGKQYPIKAVDFLVKNGFDQKRGYHEYRWGGYLIFRAFPVFVDGRADVYGDEFMSRYMNVYQLKENWNQILDEFHVVYVLMERDHPLNTLLASSGQWEEVYKDDIAKVFTRHFVR